MPSSSLARLKSSRQKRLCCVHSNWSTFRWGMNEHSMPAPQANFFWVRYFEAGWRTDPCDRLSVPAASAAAVWARGDSRPREEIMCATSLWTERARPQLETFLFYLALRKPEWRTTRACCWARRGVVHRPAAKCRSRSEQYCFHVAADGTATAGAAWTGVRSVDVEA